MNQVHTKIIRKPAVTNKTGFSKSTLYNRIKDGTFPPPISLGARAVGFIASEVDAIIQAWCEEQTPKQIKQLVSELIKQRKAA
ncbi:AlpA family transcriptional regulator [Colwellia sp. BRX9-1]|jgi:prophage regulatory protein|uniref:helix-turn-helix transcriptional regulator n=1 Tax=Colwellia sp. BRX9-1 TaxID=2759830 RepID=UPI0015F69FCD|nr:AlpA family transcriptional regulator [Colwellia sp. BRX9-1]MBA6350716.1 AlpA family transcriptional regulator [Colwellia sp. BRX9-1]